jgi:hypothetical protein
VAQPVDVAALQQLAQDHQPRPVGRRPVLLPDAAPDDLLAVGLDLGGQAPDEVALADPHLAGDQDQAALAGAGADQGLPQPPELGLPADEDLPRGRLGRLGRRGGGADGRPVVVADLLALDVLVELLELAAGAHAALVVEQLQEVEVHVDGLGGPAGPVQGQHQAVAQVLVEPVVADLDRQLADDVGLPAGHQVGLGLGLDGRPALALQPGDAGLVASLVAQVLQRRGGPPQGERLGQDGRGPGRFGGRVLQRRPPLGQESLEAEHVQPIGGDVELVGVVLGEDAGPGRLLVLAGRQELAQPRHGAVERVAGPGRRPVPEGVQQPGHGHRLVGVEQEEGEHRALAGPAQLERAACVFDLQRPEDPEPHTAPHCSAASRVSYPASGSI